MWSIIKKENIKSFLERYPELSDDFDLFKLHENGDNVFLPRYFCENYPSNHIIRFEPKFTPQTVDFKFTKDLRPVQEKVMKIISPIFEKNGSINGVIKAACGSGKTCLAIYIASKLALKTLIVVDKGALFDQWSGEILTFTNLQSEEIGCIKQNKFPKKNEPIIIATIQTLLSKFRKDPKKLYDDIKELGIGLVVFDEVHNTSSSEKYGKISSVLSTLNILGLSATPYKFGGQDILMKNVIGPIIYSGSDYNLKPEIEFISYYSGIDKYKYLLYKIGNFVAKKAMYNKYILTSAKYLSLFPKFVKDDLLMKHKVIIICWTENQVKAISAELRKVGITCNEFYGKSRDFSLTDDVLVATYSFAGTGFDFAGLSSLIYACPLSGKVSLIQTAGRILRKCEGKTSPRIRYLVDLTIDKQSVFEANRATTVFQNEFGDDVVIRKYNENK